LLGYTSKPIRYNVPQVGLLTYTEFLLVVSGLFWVSKRKELLVILALLAIAPLSAAVTNEDTPNMQRAIFMAPFLEMLAAYGLFGLMKISSKWNIFKLILIGGLTVNFIYFWHMYFVHQKMSIASYYRNGGNLELVNELKTIKNNYKEIVLTNNPDSLYPWMAYFGGYDPENFNNSFGLIAGGVRKFQNLVFSTDKCPLNSALNQQINGWDNVLFVDAEGCQVDKKFDPLVKVQLIDTILRPDNSPPYYLRIVESIK